MARVVVTGASGFIGGHIARRLHTAGHEVLATGRDVDRLRELAALGIATQACDLVHDDLSSLLMDRELVVHGAALSSPWGKRDDFIAANVDTTQRLLDAARHVGAQRFVHISSPSIYFQLRDQYDTAEAFEPPRQWINAYAETKWLAEQRVRAAAAQGLPSIMLRPRAVFGEGDRAIFPRLLKLAQRGWFPRIGDGRAMIDVTYVANVVAAVEAAMRPQAPTDGRAFNITNGEPMPVNVLLALLFRAVNLRVRMIRLPRSLAVALGRLSETWALARPGQPEPRLSRYGVGVLGYSQTLDISAAREQLGYRPMISVAEGIERFASWWKDHAAD